MITETQTGTSLVNEIEYNEYPPPQQLRKAMERQWADELVQNGLIRLRKLEYYRELENDLLGDPNEGQGLYHLERHPMQTDSVNDVYAWCLFLPDIGSERLLALAEEGEYDCTVVIHAVENLLARMQKYLRQHYGGLWLHCGYVQYDRGAEVNKEILRSQKFHFNVFQKAPRFRDEREYRVSITNCTFERRVENYLDLHLGDCRDIISIQPLLDNSLQGTILASRP
jgi:hypothetical protein